MRAELRKVNSYPARSFSSKQDRVPDVNVNWHYHHEVEIIHYQVGSGTHFIGNHIRRFQAGDIVLIGANLPHFTRFDKEYFTETAPDIRVIHFREDFWGTDFLNLPENALIKSILEKSKRGILIKGQNREIIAALVEQILQVENHDKLPLLIQTLNKIALCDQLEILCSVGYNYNLADSENERITDIYNYTFKNFNKKIYIEDIAAVAKISPNSFCRYFKSRVRKTYSQFVLEVRVGQACKLLIEDKLNLKQIAFECGFNNPVTFHRYFKRFIGKSPLVYQKEFGLKKSSSKAS
jgi:AraC-like DNA-binding protein